MIIVVSRRRDGISSGRFATNFATAISFGITLIALGAGGERGGTSLLFATTSEDIEIVAFFADGGLLGGDSFAAASQRIEIFPFWTNDFLVNYFIDTIASLRINNFASRTTLKLLIKIGGGGCRLIGL